MDKAAFLDRDGVIIEDRGYVGAIEEVKFLPDVAKAIKLLNESRFKVFIVTNQAGVARGYFTEEAVIRVNEYIQEYLSGEGALIDKAYYCPHHLEGIIDEYAKWCNWRKPNPGMLQKAARDFDIDLKNSFIVGDKMTDIEAGHKAGCKTVLVSKTESLPPGEIIDLTPDYFVLDLYEAARLLAESH